MEPHTHVRAIVRSFREGPAKIVDHNLSVRSCRRGNHEKRVRRSDLVTFIDISCITSRAFRKIRVGRPAGRSWACNAHLSRVLSGSRLLGYCLLTVRWLIHPHHRPVPFHQISNELSRSIRISFNNYAARRSIVKERRCLRLLCIKPRRMDMQSSLYLSRAIPGHANKGTFSTSTRRFWWNLRETLLFSREYFTRVFSYRRGYFERGECSRRSSGLKVYLLQYLWYGVWRGNLNCSFRGEQFRNSFPRILVSKMEKYAFSP